MDKDQEIAHETREKEEVGLWVLPEKVFVTRVHLISCKMHSLVHVAAGDEHITPPLFLSPLLVFVILLILWSCIIPQQAIN